MSNNVLVLAAHPDDEVLGCGGTIAKLADQGAIVRVAFFADGVMSRSDEESFQKSDLAARRLAAKKACEILGVHSVSFGDFPDNGMDTVSALEVTKSVELLLQKFKPEVVFTHHVGDVNVDHRRLHEAVVTACRPQRDSFVNTLLSFEVPSSTEWQLPGSAPIFAPNWFVDISKTLGRKLDALEAYYAELRQWPHPRSREGVRYLAHWRGATVGVDAAEAFMLGRNLV